MVERRAGVMPYFVKPYNESHHYGDGSSLIVVGMVSPKDLTKQEWLLPKGHIEEGESITEAAMREAYEEMGVVGCVRTSSMGNQPCLVVSELIPLPTQSWVEGGDEPYILKPTLVICTYVALLVSNYETAVSPEGRQIKWVDRKDAIEALTFPAHKLVVRKGQLA